jgi:hypothetical protein
MRSNSGTEGEWRQHHDALASRFFFGGSPQKAANDTPSALAILARLSVVGTVWPSSHCATAEGLIPIFFASAAWVSPSRLSRHRTMRSLSSTLSTKHALASKSITVE